MNIRHSLTDALLRFGGNIGYSVRLSRWNQGLGTTMLAMALAYVKRELGLDRVLITCDDQNIASARMIEKNGVERLTRRYWIEIG